MNIINSYNNITAVKEQNPLQGQIKKTTVKQKEDLLDKFSNAVINNKDITDTVTAPRAIFKGYLLFTTGTALNAIAGMIKKGKLSKGLCIVGSLISILGTFNFVKPFLIKNKNLTKSEK